MNQKILTGYTPEQIEKIKEAAYKISDAYHILKDVSDKMFQNRQWCGQGDIAHVAHVINEQLVGKNGCLAPFLKVL